MAGNRQSLTIYFNTEDEGTDFEYTNWFIEDELGHQIDSGSGKKYFYVGEVYTYDEVEYIVQNVYDTGLGGYTAVDVSTLKFADNKGGLLDGLK
ncbi:hypothetical protein D307_gp169 [Bacillus phage Bastille]|uniref:Uncharacterized protein n=3 Tax=Bastillevirus TaxID=1918010 RepID=J9PLN8_9CAUD|nr:hypothetical protein D307_gp169 [Bacillus phage Bastille]YP_009037064.1 hypothetical protein FP74_gp198 [Bacillus phage CAM003]AEQ34295.1 hypothetical protein [Bacillus phage Bastille]AHZ09598.1 hypothetical protein [Bacillus phage CAM003]ASU01015.1 hypothetical protein ANTHONY_175 [Bacillus phage Anthony]